MRDTVELNIGRIRGNLVGGTKPNAAERCKAKQIPNPPDLRREIDKLDDGKRRQCTTTEQDPCQAQPQVAAGLLFVG